MQGDAQVLDFLNKALTNELTAINQYWLHYRVLKNWGIEKLAEYERHESIDEMKHADTLADRILFLEGLPNFQALHKLKVGETVEEILKADPRSRWRRSRCSRTRSSTARRCATTSAARSSSASSRARSSMSTSSRPSSR